MKRDGQMPDADKMGLARGSAPYGRTGFGRSVRKWRRGKRRACCCASFDEFGKGTKEPKRVRRMSKQNMGSSIDDFLKEEAIFEDAQAQAVKEVVAW